MVLSLPATWREQLLATARKSFAHAALFHKSSSYLQSVLARRRRPTQAYSPRLMQSPGVLSREFLPLFLPVGKDFTKWALHFLPVGKPGLQVSDSQHTDRILSQADAA